MRIAAFTGGATIPSGRFRVEQFVAPLAARGLAVDVFASRAGAYPPPGKSARPWWLARTIAERVPNVARSWRYDVTLLQREMVSTLATLERFTRSPRVFDVDDAIWLYRGGGFVRRIARGVDLVIAGNDFLAEYFRRLHPDVEVLPTAVDTERFCPAAAARHDDTIVVGWSGTRGGYLYFDPVVPALAELLRRYPNVRLRFVSDAPPPFSGLDPARVDWIPWSPETEVTGVQSFDVGLMPLVDTDWDRGKCSYKMLLYMACGVTPVVSPIGMNVDVLAASPTPVGMSAWTTGEWLAALSALVEDEAMRRSMADEARRVVVDRYSVSALAPRLAGLLQRVARAAGRVA